MSDEAQTPLTDLLKSVPIDARAEYEHSPTSHSYIPYGRLCAESLAEITALRAEVERLRAGYAEAIEDIESWGPYAPQYFSDKHDLSGCLERHRAVLKEQSDE